MVEEVKKVKRGMPEAEVNKISIFLGKLLDFPFMGYQDWYIRDFPIEVLRLKAATNVAEGLPFFFNEIQTDYDDLLNATREYFTIVVMGILKARGKELIYEGFDSTDGDKIKEQILSRTVTSFKETYDDFLDTVNRVSGDDIFITIKDDKYYADKTSVATVNHLGNMLASPPNLVNTLNICFLVGYTANPSFLEEL